MKRWGTKYRAVRPGVVIIGLFIADREGVTFEIPQWAPNQKALCLNRVVG